MRRLLPPALVLLLLVLGVAVGLVLPIVGPMTWALRWPGAVVFVAGALLTTRSAARFSDVGTNIKTFDDPDTLVLDGAFRLTRNPMYAGFLLLLVGVAWLVGSLTAWVAPAAFFVAANWWYIPFEEQRLETRFGDSYERYRRSVPRWISLDWGRRE